LYQKQQEKWAISQVDVGFEKVLRRISQVRVLSFKFCPHVTNNTLNIIQNSANPFFLRELYVDGCDKITSFEDLVLPRKSPDNPFYR
jgi:hypothetical protein